jgi:hypothetical protein
MAPVAPERKAQYAIAAPRDRVENESWGAASRDVEDLIVKRGWRVKTDNPARQALTGVLVTLRSRGQGDFLTLLDDYAAVVERLATAEVDLLRRRSDVDRMVEGVAIWTVLGDDLLVRACGPATEDHGMPPRTVSSRSQAGSRRLGTPELVLDVAVGQVEVGQERLGAAMADERPQRRLRHPLLDEVSDAGMPEQMGVQPGRAAPGGVVGDALLHGVDAEGPNRGRPP